MDTSTSGLSSPQQSDEIVVANKNSSELDEPRSATPAKTIAATSPTSIKINLAPSNGHNNNVSTGTSSLNPVGETKVQTQQTHNDSAATSFPNDVKPVPLTNGLESTTSIVNPHTPNTTPISNIRGRGRPPGRGRGGRPRGNNRGSARGGKRKRNSSNPGNDDDDDDTSDSEVYTPLTTQTKSGRSITKPITYVPPPPTSSHHYNHQLAHQPTGASPTSAPATASALGQTSSTAATATTTTQPASAPTHKRKRVYRRNPEAAVCKSCLRGTSPSNNMIVFCDGCNSAYHRYCHHPPIDQSVVDQLDKEWFCVACEQERAISLAPSTIVDVSGYMPLTTNVSEKDRRRFFSTQSYGTLVSLLTAATTLHPTLPVFTREFREKGRIDDAVAAGFEVKPLPPVLPIAMDKKEEKLPAEHPAHYPRPGYGLMQTLPPDREDEHYLVDEEDCDGVFSHVYQTDTNAANSAFTTKSTPKKART